MSSKAGIYHSRNGDLTDPIKESYPKSAADSGSIANALVDLYRNCVPGPGAMFYLIPLPSKPNTVLRGLPQIASEVKEGDAKETVRLYSGCIFQNLAISKGYYCRTAEGPGGTKHFSVRQYERLKRLGLLRKRT